MRFDAVGLPEDDTLLRFDVKEDPRHAAPAVALHEGECLVDDEYDGEACCPLGDVEES
jgi:hypothetical protein